LADQQKRSVGLHRVYPNRIWRTDRFTNGKLMIYCDDCAFDRDWPETNYRVVARCEICGTFDECNDKASSLLPVKKKDEPNEPAEDQVD
jgi:hypothetical protein